MTDACPKCGAPIPDAGGPGRPKIFCSTGCRRLAEYEIRRLNETIGKLEDSARSLRNPATLHLESDALHLDFLAAEIARAEARLRALITADG